MPTSYNAATRAEAMPEEFIVKNGKLFCKWCRRYLSSLRSDNIRSHLRSITHQKNKKRPEGQTRTVRAQRKKRRKICNSTSTFKTQESEVNEATENVSVYVMKETTFSMVHPENFEGGELVRCYPTFKRKYSIDSTYHHVKEINVENDFNLPKEFPTKTTSLTKKVGDGLFLPCQISSNKMLKIPRKKSSFNTWASYKRKEITATYPDMKFGEVSKLTGELWSEMSHKEKNIWKQKVD